jgi:hypothetical protein
MAESTDHHIAASEVQTSAGAVVVGRSLWADARRRLWRDRGAMICLVVIVIYALVAVGAAIYDAPYGAHDANTSAFRETKDYSNLN